jgi:hypothetical protein
VLVLTPRRHFRDAHENNQTTLDPTIKTKGQYVYENKVNSEIDTTEPLLIISNTIISSYNIC